MVGLQAVSRVDTVGDVMTGWVVAIKPTDSLLKARDLMTQSRVSQLVVTGSRDRATGFISKRDIARFLLEDPTSRRLEDIPVSEASSTSIPTIRSNLPVFNAARMFDTENLAYTVVTNDKPLLGVMTETDLCHYFSRKFPGKFRVLDFMTRDFIFAKSTYPVLHVAHAIAFRQPSVPVIDEELVGILTLSDLLSIREKLPQTGHGRITSDAESEVALITTKDLMTLNPITTKEDIDLAHAAQIMLRKGVGSLPVTDSDSTVVGLLTKHDVVRALGRIGSNLTEA